MADVVVVGAGISGVACAREVSGAGHRVRVLDAGRRPGGRMALRRHAGRVVDVGASYLTVTDDAFRAVVDDWADRGLARPWTDTFVAWSPQGREHKNGPVRWAAPDGLRSLVADLATGLDVRQETRVGSTSDLDADAVVLAMPDPQARRLVPADHPLHAALDDPYEPSIALTAGWPERTWPDEDGFFVNDHPHVSWVADDGLRRGDRAPVLVVHATADLAQRHLADPDVAAEPLLAGLRDVVDVPAAPPHLVHVQRWTYARPAGSRDAPFVLGDDLVGACGDGWGPRSSVEAAFLSGRAIGRALAERLA